MKKFSIKNLMKVPSVISLILTVILIVIIVFGHSRKMSMYMAIL